MSMIPMVYDATIRTHRLMLPNESLALGMTTTGASFDLWMDEVTIPITGLINDSATALLRANSTILLVSWRIQSTITGTILTAYQVGTPASSGAYGTGLTLLGAGNTGVSGGDFSATAAKLRVTVLGIATSGGSVKLNVLGVTGTPATS